MQFVLEAIEWEKVTKSVLVRAKNEAAVHRPAALQMRHELETGYWFFEREPDMVFTLQHNRPGQSRAA